MKMKIICLLLILAMLFTACAPTQTPGSEQTGDYDTVSARIYEDALGTFYDYYTEAKAAESISERYALMAMAEGKLLSSAVMLPLTASGGGYAISRAVPHTTPYALWGNDSDRYRGLLVCTEFIKSAHIEEMQTQWNALRGTGNYTGWAREYLRGQGYTLKDTYSVAYASDPKTWDVLATSQSADFEAVVNTFDGLYAYDNEGVLQPALAERYEEGVDESGNPTYTFYLRPGLTWVDSQGREVAKVKADDFVAGMQHMLDAAGGLEYLVQGIILNATEYITGTVTDFSAVGVKAVDDTTLVYTLEEECPYFMTMLGYGVFAPMSREFYTSRGGRFGDAFDPSDPAYVYGTSFDTIAYCGAYRVSNATAENTIVYRANPAYWDAGNVSIKTVTWLFNDGTDATKAYNDAKAGLIDSTGLTAAAAEAAKADGLFTTYGYVTPTGAVSYMMFYNLNRIALANSNDGSVATSKDTQAVKRATAALQNVHFRRALSFAADRSAYNAQSVGEDLKQISLRNTYTPGNFVALPEEVTVTMNGTQVTYPEGTQYGKILQDQLDADGVPIRVWDSEADGGAGSSDGFDGWYHPEAAKQELATAVQELEALGIPVSREDPIYIDLPYFAANETFSNRANAYKQSVEKALDGAVVIRLNVCNSRAEWRYAGYDIYHGYEANYDVYDLSGWGPDYGDPATYLDTFLPDYEGYMTKCIGIF